MSDGESRISWRPELDVQDDKNVSSRHIPHTFPSTMALPPAVYSTGVGVKTYSLVRNRSRLDYSGRGGEGVRKGGGSGCE